MEQYQTIVLQIIIFRLMNKLGEVAMPTQNTNYHITAIASALATCLDRSVEVGKISEMTLCLLRLGVSNYSPLMKRSISYILDCQLYDGLWSTPLTTAQNVEILSRCSLRTDCYIDGLDRWKFNGLWGQNTRDIPRLACSSEIIECLCSVCPDYIKAHSAAILKAITSIWARDISMVPFTFKAISYVFIRSQLNQFLPIGVDEIDLRLFSTTLRLLLQSMNNSSYISSVLGIERGTCSIHYVLNLNITIISTRENLDIISDFLTYNEKEEYDQRNLLSSSTAHGDSSDGGCRGVEICNLSFSYNQKNIFDDFSFKFSYGNIYEIRGPRGIGKSTLLKIIYNLLSPSNGEVLIDGEANYRIHKLENQIFYLPSSTTPFILDMESNILLGKSPPAEFLDIINTLGLGAIIKDSCENLSTGEQLRVAMARGLISKKNIFLLDEFNANLDNKTSDQIVQMLLKKAKNGALIILVNHKSSIPGAIILELGL